MKPVYDRSLLKVSDRLMKQVAKYDSIAFEQLYNQSSGAVFGLAMSILGHQADAEDVVQETFISIYNKASTYKGKGKGMAWIFTITRNHALMKIRERNKHSHIDLDEVHNVGNENTIEEDIHKETLVKVLLNTLKEDERQIVVMHAMSNMKHKDIAQVMNLPLSTVLSKYKRSLDKLRLRMEVNEYET